MSEDNLINELLQQTLSQMESDTLIKLRFTPMADAQLKYESIWKIIVGYQSHSEPPMRIFGLLLNWMVTNKKPVMLLSKDLLDKYLAVSDLPRKTCDSRTWKQVEKVFSGSHPFLKWIDGKGRIEGGKRIAGTVELIHPVIRKAMADHLGGELFLQEAKSHFIALRDQRTPVVVSVSVNVEVDVDPLPTTPLKDAQAPLGLSQREEIPNSPLDHDSSYSLDNDQINSLVKKLEFIVINDRRPSKNSNFPPNYQQAENFLVKLKNGHPLTQKNIENIERMYQFCPKAPEPEKIELQNPWDDSIKTGIPKSEYVADYEFLARLRGEDKIELQNPWDDSIQTGIAKPNSVVDEEFLAKLRGEEYVEPA